MNTHPNISDPDGFYAGLVQANENLTLEQSAELSMRLVFLLANQIGDADTLSNCIAIARKPFPTANGASQ